MNDQHLRASHKYSSPVCAAGVRPSRSASQSQPRTHSRAHTSSIGRSYQPQIGKGITLVDGDDATIIACGMLVERSLEAAAALRAEGIHARVVEMHTIKPLDAELVVSCAIETGAIVSAEEHGIIGGLGGAIAECRAETYPAPLDRIRLADTFAECGPYLELLDKYGMSVDAIIAAVRRVIERKSSPSVLNRSEKVQNA